MAPPEDNNMAQQAPPEDKDKIEVMRRQRKAALTKHLGSLERAIAEEEVSQVTDGLRKFKLCFTSLRLRMIRLWRY